MWAQMIKSRIRPGQEATVQQLPQELGQRFQSSGDSGPSRILVLQDQNNPGTYISIIFFESEAKAREFERSPEQEAIRQRMMQIWEGDQDFTDLNVIHELNR